MFIQDLYLLAFDSAEIRTPLLHLKGEIFRKGLSEWEPKFVVKCKGCEKEFQEKVERCDCGKSDLVEPDSNQTKYFEGFRKSCNIFDQSFEDILQTISDDQNIVDDAFIFLNKQYGWVDKKLWSRVIEIRRIHPALMELDLDKNGLPKNSHWLCPFHREETSIKPIKCKE